MATMRRGRAGTCVVLLAVVIPILMDVDISTVFFLDEPLTTETGATFDLIEEAVGQDASVLMSFDYDAAYMGELQLQAESLFHHLADRQARIIVTSLTPEGAGLAQILIDDVLGQYDYQAGQDYVNLGYLPGEAALALVIGIISGVIFGGNILMTQTEHRIWLNFERPGWRRIIVVVSIILFLSACKSASTLTPTPTPTSTQPAKSRLFPMAIRKCVIPKKIRFS